MKTSWIPNAVSREIFLGASASSAPRGALLLPSAQEWGSGTPRIWKQTLIRCGTACMKHRCLEGHQPTAMHRWPAAYNKMGTPAKPARPLLRR